MNRSQADDSVGARLPEDLVVFAILNDSVCSECGVELFPGSSLRLEDGKPLCMECADLGHLVFLPRGDTALTRRSSKYSMLRAVVVRFSRSRRRYERQGVLVEPEALDRAEIECTSDEEQRRRRRERAALNRDHADSDYLERFARQIHSTYPGCAPAEALVIAEHACERYSRRIGRSAAAKRFEPEAVDLAVRAHVRHVHTDYDRQLGRGRNRAEARADVAARVEQVLEGWRTP